ncbi:MAG TPA: glycosyl hydrolase family 18 protein [Gemmatimonadaceae bacterium]|jgi:spore germination protein YaaH
MRLVTLLLLAARVATAQAPDALWYVRNSDEGIAAFAANAHRISVIAPQVYGMDSTGAIRGGTDPRIVAIARDHGVKLVPLVMNPGFSVTILHQIVTVPAVRTNAARSLAALCRAEKLHGIQLDFENLYVRDRDAFTAFVREAVDSVHRAGCELSAAVVPRTDDDRGTRPYHQWMYDYWRGAYDYKALADTLDFISYMTYAQHTGGSTPGPVAGYEWMVASLDYVLAAGVPPSKISLGLASYSDYWTSAYDWRTGSRTQARDIAYPELMRIIQQARATPRWDKRQRAWVAMWEDHGVFEHAWIEDARAFKDKLALVRKHHLRGYSVWLLGTEDPKVWGVVGNVAR